VEAEEVAVEVKSPWLPLAGVVLVWAFYGCFTLVESGASVAPGDIDETGTEPGGLLSRSPNTGRESRPEPCVRRERPDTPAITADEKLTASEPRPQPERQERFRISPEDAALLAVLTSFEKSGDLQPLEAFVAEHPDHALARAALVFRLLRLEADDAAVRLHAEVLQELMPASGLPDLIVARLELAAGRDGSARDLLVRAAEKDFTWLPDTELFRLKVSHDLATEAPLVSSLRDAFGMHMHFCQFVRGTAELLIMSEEREGMAEAARPVFELGNAMQNHGCSLIENLIGRSIAAIGAAGLKRSGELSSEDVAAVRRGRMLRDDAHMVAQTVEESLVGDPQFMRRYLQNVVEHGELRAARRAFMDRLTQDLRSP
jgi:hypothetical protein